MTTSTSRVNIDFVTQYVGRGNVQNAHKDILGLGSAAKKLAGLFAIGSVVAFGKASVTAFTEADQAFKVLGHTLSNLGLESQAVGIQDYIDKLALSSGVVKENLIPALQSLATYTHDVGKAQELLSLSMDISAGTGNDLNAVTLALGKAYGGSNKALAKLGAGLSAAQLKSKDFAATQKVLTATFGGEAALAADTYAGRISRIGVAFTQMKENIGQGLVTGFEGANTSAESFAHTLDNITQAGTVIGAIFGRSFKIIADGFHVLSKIPILGNQLKHLASGLDVIFGVTQSVTAAHDALLRSNDAAQVKALKDAAAQKKIRADAMAAQKKADASTLAASNAKLKAERDALNLKLAGSTIDMQNIEIQAALQRGQTQSVTDVLLLQRAILNGNGDQAEVLAQKVLTANNLVMDVKGNISNLSTAKDPFKDWPATSSKALTDIASIQLALANLVAKPYIIQVMYSGALVGGSSVALGAGGDQGASSKTDITGSGITIPTPSVTSINPNNGADSNGNKPVVNVTVQLGNQTIANAVTQTQVDQSASGIPSSFQRSGLGTPLYPW
jgi:hypothetical protein